ncbi:MAG: DNA glycosylase AlkZ-like family protein, partial [Candidatus Limnocylindrales bacterium]
GVVHLLPNYDEFLVAYRDRTASLDAARSVDLAAFPLGSILAPVIIVDGQVWGSWKRRSQGSHVLVELGPHDAFSTTVRSSLDHAARNRARFLGSAVTVVDPLQV